MLALNESETSLSSWSSDSNLGDGYAGRRCRWNVSVSLSLNRRRWSPLWGQISMSSGGTRSISICARARAHFRVLFRALQMTLWQDWLVNLRVELTDQARLSPERKKRTDDGVLWNMSPGQGRKCHDQAALEKWSDRSGIILKVSNGLCYRQPPISCGSARDFDEPRGWQWAESICWICMFHLIAVDFR